MKHLLYIVAFLVVAGWAGPAAAQKYPERRMAREGNRLFEKNDAPGAGEKYAAALEIDTEFGEARFNLGNVMLAGEQLDEAIELYKQVLRATPDDQEAKYNLAYAQKLKQEQEQDEQDGGGDQDQPQGGQGDQPQDDQGNEPEDNPNQNPNQPDDTPGNQPPPQSQSGGQPRQPQLTEQEADRMLEAMQAEEDRTREKMEDNKVPSIGRSGKNW